MRLMCLDSCAEGLQGFNVKVNRSVTNLTAAQSRNDHIASSGEHRTAGKDRDTASAGESFHLFQGCLSQRLGVDVNRMTACELDTAAKRNDHVAHDVNVNNARNIVDCAGIGG